MKKYILSFDIGTSSAKTVLFDLNFKVIAHAFKKYETSYPQTGWAEQPADQWWDALVDNTQAILEENNIESKDIVAIGIDAFSTTVVPINTEGFPIRPGLIWMDRRATNQHNWIEENLRDQTWSITGNISDPGNVAPKIMWIKENEPEIYDSTSVFLNANGYLVYKLTGEFSLDKSQAGLSQLCDKITFEYSDFLLNGYGIDKNKLPPIYECTDIVGVVNEEASVLTGLEKGTPVIAGSMDNVAAGLGAGIYKNGEVYISGGTVTTNNVCLSKPLFNEDLHTYPHIVPGTWITAGCTDYGGGVVRWLNDEIFAFSDIQEVGDLIDSSNAAESSLIFLPYMVGQRSPLWNDNTTGIIMGLKPNTTRRDLVRAAIEGTTYGSRHVLDLVQGDGVEISGVKITGGSANSSGWVQVFSDVLDKTIEIPGSVDLPPLGVAIAAAYGIGIIESFEEAIDQIEIRATFYPNKDNYLYYSEMYQVFRSLYNSVLTQYDMLSDSEKKIKEKNNKN